MPGNAQAPEKKTFRQVLKKGTYQVMDAEFGEVMDLESYRKFIDEVILPITQTELRYDALSGIPAGDKLNLTWQLGENSTEFQVYSDTDYLDIDAFFKGMNELLEFVDTRKRFFVFDHVSFGQEFGFAYLSPGMGKKLAEAEGITLRNL